MIERRILVGGVLLGLVVSFAWRALGQTPDDLLHVWSDVRVRTDLPAGTDRIVCELPVGIPAGTVVGTVTAPATSPVSVPLTIPRVELRCRACNAAGCSALSPNALVLRQRTPGDCNGDGTASVSDIVCVNVEIFTGP